MINYTWKVTELYTQTIEGKEDYVVLAHCETIGVDGEYTASVPNVIQFSTEEVRNFYSLCRFNRRINCRLD
jgi:hypothetical protein